jgi:hypothetical protein
MPTDVATEAVPASEARAKRRWFPRLLRKGPPEIGEWTFVCGIRTKLAEFHFELGWYKFEIGLFKLHTEPELGMQLTREHYHGFWLEVLFWLPVVFRRSW